MLNAGSCAQHGLVFDARFQIKGKHGVGDLEGFGGNDVNRIAAQGAIHPVSARTSRFNHLGLGRGAVVAAAVDHGAAEGDVHANITVEKETIHERDITGKNLPRPCLEHLSQRWHVEGLFDFDGPHGSLAQLRPFDNRTGYIHHMLHRSNTGKTVENKGGQFTVHVPCSNRSDFEGWTQPVHEQTHGFARVGSSEQFHHGQGLGLTVHNGLRGAITPAHDAHASLHLATLMGFSVPPH